MGFPIQSPIALMKRDRFFYSVTSFIFLLLTLIGFRKFYLGGIEANGHEIPRPILTLVIIHGLALSLWVVLLFVQSVLIASKNRLVHMRLGWAGAAIALTISISGLMASVAAPRAAPWRHVAGLTYPQFMLPMLCEVTAFTVFAALGIAFRRKPAIHRSMMLLATLSVISGATSRTRFFGPVFGTHGWTGLFGPVFALGAVLIVVRTATTRSFDKWFAAGYAGLACLYLAAMNVAIGETWARIAARIVQH